jgi:diguanylate cyclase (GGDEF)-like protein/PAS domain S-box-containing protein
MWGLIGLAGALAVILGLRGNRPARTAPWLLLAAAILTLAVGQFPVIGARSSHGNAALPHPLDFVVLAGCAFFAAGLIIFIRCRIGEGNRRKGLLNALCLIAGPALLGWIYLVLPSLHQTALSGDLKAFAIANSVADTLVFTVLVWFLADGGWRIRPGQLLALGTLGLLVSDLFIGERYLHGSFPIPAAADLGWVVCHGAWGAAALHPAMTKLTRPVIQRQSETSPVQMALLAFTSLVVPGVLLLIYEATGGPAVHRSTLDVSVIACCAAALGGLWAWRFANMASGLRHAQAVMEALRMTSLSISAAATMGAVVGEVQEMVEWLTGPERHHPAVLALWQDGLLRAVGAAPGHPPVPAELPLEVSEDWLSLLSGSASELRAVLVSGRRASPDMVGDDSALLCPLALPNRPSGAPLIGVLAVFGTETQLAALSETLEVLTQRVALVVERLVLSDEVIQHRNEAYFRALVHDSSDAIMIVDNDDRIRYATPSASTIFGDVAIEGSLLPDLIPPDEWGDISSVLAGRRDGAGDDAEKDWRITSSDDTYLEIQVRCSDLREDPAVGGMVLTLRDVTAQRELEHELKYQVLHDPLTGLPNRYLFRERAKQATAQARARGTIVALLLIDMDDFRIVNETLGNDVGDELLVAAASRLTAVTGGAGITARRGNDEFALIMEDLIDGAAADAMAAAVVQAFTEPFTLTTGSVTTTVSIGVATTEDGASLSEMVSRAELVLGGAKAAGKRQWGRYKPVRGISAAVTQSDLRAALDEAVSNSAFTLAYQPIVTLSSGEIVGFEALVRWPSQEWGVIYPGQFLALAEETGQIVSIGSWVLERATADTAGWQREMPHQPPLYVGVNVSARQFRDPGFVGCVRRVLASSGLPPSSLQLEFMESLLMYRDEQVRANLDELKSIGVRLAMNGFRTEHLSLNYLRELPMDVLKIEKTFVDGIAVSAQRRALAEVVIRIAKSLQMTIVATGIESEAQRDLLISIGCPFGQGHLISWPLGTAEAEALVRAGRRLAPGLLVGSAT